MRLHGGVASETKRAMPANGASGVCGGGGAGQDRGDGGWVYGGGGAGRDRGSLPFVATVAIDKLHFSPWAITVFTISEATAG